MPHLSNLPDKLAGYSVRGALKWSPHSKVLLGEDATLGRRVLIWLRPTTEAPLDVVRRDIGRRTRLRWLTTGRQGDQQWDALWRRRGVRCRSSCTAKGRWSGTRRTCSWKT